MQKFTSLLKYGLIGCFLLSISTKGYSQISDLDAKLTFQKITDAYDASAYYSAATQAEQLKNKMGSWTPKVLYIYLQSAYKAYNGGKEADNKFGNRHETFVAFKTLADSFFPMIDKDYPKEKYADIVTAQQYFADMVKKSAYQTTRTPEKAIAFLNDCANKFRNRAIGNADDFGTYNIEYAWPLDESTPYINFRVDSGYLRIVVVSKKKSQNGGRFNRVVLWNDIIDLKHAPATDENKTSVDDRVYIFSHHYYTFDRQGDFDKVDTIALSISWQADKQVALYKNKFSKTMLVKTPKTVMKYPLDILFDQKNKDFVDGKYADRTREAFDYLLNYYPKEKSPVVVVTKKEDAKVNGF